MGVHLVSAAFVNCYLIEHGSGLTLVDTGTTHAHFDEE
jgi:hypothetical protein